MKIYSSVQEQVGLGFIVGYGHRVFISFILGPLLFGIVFKECNELEKLFEDAGK